MNSDALRTYYNSDFLGLVFGTLDGIVRQVLTLRDFTFLVEGALKKLISPLTACKELATIFHCVTLSRSDSNVLDSASLIRLDAYFVLSVIFT
ncbi:ferrochelatase [Photobacterium sp. SKA34]|nr:ferrochelatase [Photobacterium sp. SKA34]